MGKERKPHTMKSQRGFGFPELSILCAAFLLGTLLGCLCAGRISDAEGSALAFYVEDYLSAAREGRLETPGLLSVIIETFRWPVIIMLLSCTVIGLIGIPVVFCVRGFLLSFAVATFIRVLGGAGALLSMILFGITGMLSVPVLFVLGTRGLFLAKTAAASLMGQKHARSIRRDTYFVLCGICTAILICCAFVEQTVISSVVVVLAGTF